MARGGGQVDEPRLRPPHRLAFLSPYGAKRSGSVYHGTCAVQVGKAWYCPL